MNSLGKKMEIRDNIVENIIDKSKGGKILEVYFDGKYEVIKLKLWAWSSALIIKSINTEWTLNNVKIKNI